jgi:four helix bundle protein
MATDFNNLRVLQAAEKMADEVWKLISIWEEFARDTLGKQLTRAIDSIGANIAESFGRYAYGEKLQFLYYARGSLFETKYWLNRAMKRSLLSSEKGVVFATQLSAIGMQLNAFANSLKIQRQANVTSAKSIVREPASAYGQEEFALQAGGLLADDEIEWLASVTDAATNLESPILQSQI